ncbi:unnamed protein product [Allacma fusca]|uniref:Aromatic amino acid beta-eliminating lyase/threonine aldolase domain-containing protein n=1 Tax=Allacma fusca TaxID=39272 RepID=A0A8J2Q0Q3_9HEXA|nr:unnamed protein product [Allacma fusca]
MNVFRVFNVSTVFRFRHKIIPPENFGPRIFYRNMYKPTNDASASEGLADLRSDTMSRPSQAMREKMAAAPVGDDVFCEDPTVLELQSRVAKLLGKEAGLFVTSGSQGNLLASLIHCQGRGLEVICGDVNHIFLYEQGGLAQFGGIQANTLPVQEDGTFSLEGIRSRIRDHTNDHYPRTCMIAIENTQNYHGGIALPLEWLDELVKIGKENNIRLHLDGARLFNAAIATGAPAERLARGFDSVTVCFSKGLGAPVGSVLCGSATFITEARRLRKALGSGMRQVGILAAAGLYCLDHMIDRLADDHANAKLVASAVAALKSPVIAVELKKVQTNMVLLLVDKRIPANDVCKRLALITDEEEAELGGSIKVLAWPRTQNKIRLVFHCDVSNEQAQKVAAKIAFVVKEFTKTLQGDQLA